MKITMAHLTRYSIILASIFCLSPNSQAETPYRVEWIRQFGTDGLDQSHSITIDLNGNAYITGSTSGDLDGVNAGGSDVYLSKFNSGGELLWHKQVGSSSNEQSYSVATDSLGNAYITGRTYGSLEGTNEGNGDVFLSKLDTYGNFIWTEQIGTFNGEVSYSVSVDQFDNAFVTGNTFASFLGPHLGSYDTFLAKFDSSGNNLWGKQFGTSDGDLGTSVAVDHLGNAYVTGLTAGSFGGPIAGGYDAFLTKYDSSGNALWTKQWGKGQYDLGQAVAVDDSGNAYVAGTTQGRLGENFYGAVDLFITKYDALGNRLWIEQAGTSETEEVHSLAVDSNGNAYVAGNTKGSLEGSNAGNHDAFLSKFDSSGNYLWSEQIGTSVFDNGFAVALDGFGNPYLSGRTQGNLGGNNAGHEDAFLAKLSPITLAGDFNRDGSVDAADYTVWRNGAGTIYETSDYDNWVANYGATSTESASRSTSIPEPNGIALLAIGYLSLFHKR